MANLPELTRPYLFHHRYGDFVVHASSPKEAVLRADRLARGMLLVPAFTVPEDQLIHAA